MGQRTIEVRIASSDTAREARPILLSLDQVGALLNLASLGASTVLEANGVPMTAEETKMLFDAAEEALIVLGRARYNQLLIDVIGQARAHWPDAMAVTRVSDGPSDNGERATGAQLH